MIIWAENMFPLWRQKDGRWYVVVIIAGAVNGNHIASQDRVSKSGRKEVDGALTEFARCFPNEVDRVR